MKAKENKLVEKSEKKGTALSGHCESDLSAFCMARGLCFKRTKKVDHGCTKKISRELRKNSRVW